MQIMPEIGWPADTRQKVSVWVWVKASVNASDNDVVAFSNGADGNVAR